MILFEAEPLNLGADVRAVGVELVEPDENREPVRGAEAAKVWSRMLPALAGGEIWGLDFFSHLDRVREYCKNHAIEFRESESRYLVIPAPKAEALEALLLRFEAETFGVRAGERVAQGDAALESELARRGADAYHSAFANYFFCGICNFENGSLVILSQRFWAYEVIRNARTALAGLDVEVRLAPS
ncbi:MAG: hypothetical protein WA755_14150 [Candidatus Acidiferrales bacterium]